MKQLLETAERIQAFLEEKMVDAEGRVLSQIDARTLEPVNEETFVGAKEIDMLVVKGFTKSEFESYENVGMTTGAWLLTLLAEYRYAPSQETLQKIRHTADGLLGIAEMGRQLEWGFFPKIYGARFSEQTSTDQVLSCLSALDAAYDLLLPQVQQKVTDFIVHAVEFWRKRDYRYTYFIYKDMRWPDLRFPPLLYLAWKYSGDESFRRDADDLTKKNLDRIPENSRFRQRELSDREKAEGVRIIEGIPDAVSMDTLNADLVLRTVPDSQYAEVWRRSIMQIFEEGQRTVIEDGSCRTLTFQDLQTGELRRAVDNGPSQAWNGIRTAWSTMIERGGMLAATYFPEERERLIAQVKAVLEKFHEPRDFNYLDPRDAQLMPARFHFKTRFVSGDSITNYLWAVRLMQNLTATKQNE